MVPHVLLGDNLAKSRAMRLANAYPEGPNVWRLDISVPQIDLSARADRKMIIFYVYLRYFTKKSRLYRTDTQIKKKNRSAKETPSHTLLCVSICVSVYFLKKSQPNGVEGNHNFLCQLTLHSIINLKGRIGARIGLDNLSEEHFFCWMLMLSFTTAF